eukprot:scaffold77641_cov36-Prasinocladus_malaysianus.AAC.2
MRVLLRVPLLLPLGGQASWLLQWPQGLTVPDIYVATAGGLVDIGVWVAQDALSLQDVGEGQVGVGGGCHQVDVG